MEYLNAFLCGGLLCLIGQILIDKTSLTPAKILVCYVVTGVILGGLGVYKPLIEWGGSGSHSPAHRVWLSAVQGGQRSGRRTWLPWRPHRRNHRRRGGNHRRHLFWLSGISFVQGQA